MMTSTWFFSFSIDSLMTTRLKSIILRALSIKHRNHLTTKE